ncbi:GntR family transcriptional regulator [Microvirga guangxiensis]|uniref:DNA-binding transcriptional regulator, GntR family n=1 Tax=Microvirga guangxiensis TaxID=549386 RepID=A0A1G5K1S2_9HYPH|nr:GntR family transcriptional regulator [Microvirga guangxiensis]SCY94171.1 DNA-binding transcriptional regulator, GntR family [Microvirga guangxiensis]
MQTLIPMRDGTGARSRKLSLTETAYQALRARVLSGELRPSAEFSEAELADELSMSKTPVREALGRLVAEGLIEAFPRRGYRVTPITVKDINDLFAIRAMTEGTAASMAALNLTPADLDRLEAMAEARYDPSQGESVQSFVKANRDFHIAIAEGANNPRLLAMVSAFLDECTRLFYLGALSRDVNPETSDDHRHIVEVLRLRDPEQARSAMVQHSERTQQGILRALISSDTTALTL